MHFNGNFRGERHVLICVSVFVPLQYSRMNAINKEKERQAFGDEKKKPHDSAGH